MWNKFNEKAYTESVKMVSKYLSAKYAVALRKSGELKEEDKDKSYKCCCIHRINPDGSNTFFIIDLEKNKVYNISSEQVKQAMKDDLKEMGTGKLTLTDKTEEEAWLLTRASALEASGLENGQVHTETVKVSDTKVKN